MHVLFDLGHPAHVHLFRNVARQLIERGDKVTITTRERGIISILLNHYGLAHESVSAPRRGHLGNATELVEHNWGVLRAALRYKRPDYLVGTSVSVAHIGRLIGRPSIVLNEDDADYVPLFARLTYPFATRIIIPAVLRDAKTARVRTHDSYHELAYLHPDNFIADTSALNSLGVKPGESYFIIRLVTLSAHHDAGERGLSNDQVSRLISELSPHGRVFINSEGGLPERFTRYAFRAAPHHMHSLLAHARMLVSDSQTMTMEAAVLGTPALRCNTFVGRCSVIEELESRFQLAWGFDPRDFETMLTTIRGCLGNANLAKTMQARRQVMLASKCNLSKWLMDQLDAGFP